MPREKTINETFATFSLRQREFLYEFLGRVLKSPQQEHWPFTDEEKEAYSQLNPEQKQVWDVMFKAAVEDA